MDDDILTDLPCPDFFEEISHKDDALDKNDAPGKEDVPEEESGEDEYADIPNMIAYSEDNDDDNEDAAWKKDAANEANGKDLANEGNKDDAADKDDEDNAAGKDDKDDATDNAADTGALILYHSVLCYAISYCFVKKYDANPDKESWKGRNGIQVMIREDIAIPRGTRADVLTNVMKYVKKSTESDIRLTLYTAADYKGRK